MALGGVGYFATGYWHLQYWHTNYWCQIGGVAATIFMTPLRALWGPL
jgi:uncharacterized oligopeptide transporter (OPT) family protein